MLVEAEQRLGSIADANHVLRVAGVEQVVGEDGRVFSFSAFFASVLTTHWYSGTTSGFLHTRPQPAITS